MKYFLKILLFIFLPVLVNCQDTAITLSPGMVDPKYDVVMLTNLDGWLFKKGNDANWAKKNIDVTTWQKLKPSGLSEKLADKNGKLECWLRLKIRLDTSFRDTPVDLFIVAWAAVDLYVDENLYYSFGNTGANGKPFKEYNPTYKLPVAFNIEKGIDHVLAIHFVDYTSSLPPYRLKSEGWLNNFIAITLPQFKAAYLDRHLENHFFRTIWLWINIILCLLFWVLAFQNRGEKNLLLIALAATIQILTIYCDQYIINRGISYFTYGLLYLAWSILLAIGAIVSLLLLVRIFRRKINLLFKVFVVVMLVCGIAQMFFSTPILLIFMITFTLGAYTYYIITSWKTLQGAQWAVLVGILLTFSFGLLLATASLTMPGSHVIILVLYTGVFLSFPLSLLVYIAMRFKEIIKEVRENAQQVVKLSDEKKEQALNQQKILQDEVNKQTAELRTTLENLKSTQSQLIQSEKMASLGELTAGIAHEIQNPLNFVNNFSEVNDELLKELKAEAEKGNLEEVKSIAKDIEFNSEKINHHGKRADAIVKGMLQHSRSSSGIREPTDINVLADEYLRLAYHGLRAKDKSFNATMKTDFDESIGNINIIPQDMGRVILNLINNAFYAVDEKRKQMPPSPKGEQGTPPFNYEPVVTVITKRLGPPSGDGGKIEIKVADNGNGIPQKVLAKIFQPFFTTKPTGQGTGLGLSLAYDIVKAHGGEIKVHTKENEGTEFIIVLPV
ncbi:MAG TPA: ATP-binding protein [Chitinophagaceae bacterium]|nr:ATP-binding protein [Chitinophagaceae bacterium]